MKRSLMVIAAATLAVGISLPARAGADVSVELVVQAGRPLRVALTETSSVHQVGQTVTGTLVEAVYAYDRIVLPAGTPVVGHIVKLQNPSRVSRARSMLAGDFSPHRDVGLEFDSVTVNGRSVAIQTVVGPGSAHVKRQLTRTTPPAAQGPDGETKTGAVDRVKQEVKDRATNTVASIKQRTRDAIATVKEPGRGERLKQWMISRLPYHPQTLLKATVYDASLREPARFGTVPERAPAPAGTMPAPASILHARLVAALDSSTTPRGTEIEAVVSQPVFAEDGRMILPEGSKLTGEVTFARPARRLHRNGQLRFLFERVEPPGQESATMLASLHAIDVSDDDRVVLDDEGGAEVRDSKARFVTPALAILAMRASLEQGEGRGFENGAAGAGGVGARATEANIGGGHFGARALGGAIGFGLVGIALSRISPPVAVGLSAYGAARSLYTTVFGKGQDVRFQADTPIEVQLAPGRSPTP